MFDEKGIAKYGDFGSATLFPPDSDLISATVGTAQFLSPECCDRKLYINFIYSKHN